MSMSYGAPMTTTMSAPMTYASAAPMQTYAAPMQTYAAPMQTYAPAYGGYPTQQPSALLLLCVGPMVCEVEGDLWHPCTASGCEISGVAVFDSDFQITVVASRGTP